MRIADFLPRDDRQSIQLNLASEANALGCVSALELANSKLTLAAERFN